MYVAAGSYCEILSVDEVSQQSFMCGYVHSKPCQFEHIDALTTDCGSIISPEGPSPAREYLVRAALVGNLKKKVFVQSTFLLPSEAPEVSMQDYRTVWDSALGAYCVSRRSTGSTQSAPMAPVVLIEGSLLSNPLLYTEEELRSIFRPTKFNWADDVEDENEPISVQPVSVQPTRSYVRPSCITISTSSEASSASTPNSSSSTPLTPFSRGASPDFPSFEVDKSHKSPLILSLNLAVTNNKTDKPDEYQKFDWLNLIRHDGQYALFRGGSETLTTGKIWVAYKHLFSVAIKLSHRSGLIVALDLAIADEPECPNQSHDAEPRPIAVVSKYLDIHEHLFNYAAHLAKTRAEVAQSVPDAEVVEGDLSADVVEDKNADVHDATAVEGNLQGEDKVEPSLASVAFEHIDLDAVFGGTADDLCEDYEGEHRAARAHIDSSAPQTTLDARHLSAEDGIPNDVSTTTTKASQGSDGHREPESASSTLPRFIPVYLKDLKNKRSLLDWTDLLAATQRAKLGGSYEHKPLQATDRSRDWFWEPTNDDNRRHYDPRILVTAAGSCINRVDKVTTPAVEEIELHHLNFSQQPVFHKTETSPEVSLWAVCSGQAQHHESVSRKGVLSSQAGKLIDPFLYCGPNALLNLKGTQLRDEVTGYVEKVYHPKGTWIFDQYDPDETVPCVAEGDAYTDIFNGPGWLYSPQPVHRMLFPRDVYRPAEDNTDLYPQEVDLEDVIVNDDGRIHVHKPRSDKNWAAFSPSRLSTVQNCSEETSDLELLSPKPKCTSSSTSSLDSSLATCLDELTILPEQSEDAVTIEDKDIYNEPAGESPLELAQAAQAVAIERINEPAVVTESTHLAEPDEPEQLPYESALAVSSSLCEAEQDDKIYNEPAAIESFALPEAEEGEQSSGEESDGYNSSGLAGTLALRDMLESPAFLLTQRHVQAIMDGKEDEAATIMAQITELRAHAPTGNNTHVYSDEDEDQVDYTDTWVKRNVRSVPNQDYLSRWSDILPVEAHEAGEVPGAENPAEINGQHCSLSPAQTNDAIPTRSWSIGDNASPEELKLERMDEDLYADVLDLIRVNEILLACNDIDISQEDPEDRKALKSNAIVTCDEISTSRGYTRPMTIEEEKEELDRGHVAGMILQEQSDAQAEVLLNAYLGHLKRYHSTSWPTISNKVSSLEVVNTEVQSLPEQQDLCVGKFTMVFIPSSLPYPPPAVVPVPDCDTMVRKSYQYALSTLPSILEGEGADSDEPTDPASDLDCSTSGQSASEKLQIGTEVDLAYFEEASENMEDGLVWDDEDSEMVLEQDGEDTQTAHQSSDTQDHDEDDLSVSSENIADMNTENLDSLLSNVSGLLATFPGSDTVVQNLSAELITVPRICEDQEEELDHDTPEHQQLAEEMEQLAAEARKLAAEAGKLAARQKEVADRLEKLAGEEKLLADGKAHLAAENELADQSAENQKAEEVVIDHAFDNISCPSAIPLAKPTFNEHFFGSFAIAVGGKASRLVMGLSGVLRSSATVLHRG